MQTSPEKIRLISEGYAAWPMSFTRISIILLTTFKIQSELLMKPNRFVQIIVVLLSVFFLSITRYLTFTLFPMLATEKDETSLILERCVSYSF